MCRLARAKPKTELPEERNRSLTRVISDQQPLLDNREAYASARYAIANSTHAQET